MKVKTTNIVLFYYLSIASSWLLICNAIPVENYLDVISMYSKFRSISAWTHLTCFKFGKWWHFGHVFIDMEWVTSLYLDVIGILKSFDDIFCFSWQSENFDTTFSCVEYTIETCDCDKFSKHSTSLGYIIVCSTRLCGRYYLWAHKCHISTGKQAHKLCHSRNMALFHEIHIYISPHPYEFVFFIFQIIFLGRSSALIQK